MEKVYYIIFDKKKGVIYSEYNNFLQLFEKEYQAQKVINHFEVRDNFEIRQYKLIEIKK